MVPIRAWIASYSGGEQAEGVPIQVLFDDPKDTITFGLVPGPASRPDYGREPDCAFPG